MNCLTLHVIFFNYDSLYETLLSITHSYLQSTCTGTVRGSEDDIVTDDGYVKFLNCYRLF